jgi:biopolymer transport protein ExbD
MKRKHRKLKEDPELDITSFMNLMIVLVPVLLLSMVFSQTAVLNLNFPPADNSIVLPKDQPLQLQVIIRKDAIAVADSRGGLIKRLPAINGQEDFQGLKEVLKQIKARMPDKKDITILAEKSTPYQVLVTTMDTVRSYPAVVAASLVNAELFPEISIGDAPDLKSKPSLKPLPGHSGGQIQ